MSVVDCHVCIIRGFFKIDHGNSTHHSDTYTYYILASRWMTIYLPFVIFVSMDEKTECRCLYFLVSILRGIIVYSNRGNYTYAYFKMHIIFL